MQYSMEEPIHGFRVSVRSVKFMVVTRLRKSFEQLFIQSDARLLQWM